MKSTKGRISLRNIHHLCFGTIRPPCKYIPFVLSGYLAVLQADERAPYRINFKMCQMWRRLNYCFISNDGQQRHVSAHRCLSKSIMLIKLHARVCVWLYACVSFPLSRGTRFVEVLNEQLALVFCLWYVDTLYWNNALVVVCSWTHLCADGNLGQFGHVHVHAFIWNETGKQITSISSSSYVFYRAQQ